MVAIREQDPLRMTEAEYLAFERESDIRHEYIDGYVVAMAGASRAHNIICANLSRVIGNQILDKNCELYQSDMRVKTLAVDYTYPDITVVCDEPDFTDDSNMILLNPLLIIEVLSPSTERHDRGRKFQDYRDIQSLQEYVLISQDNPRIERFTRQNDVWVFADASLLDETIELPSIACVLNLEDVYHKVNFEGDK